MDEILTVTDSRSVIDVRGGDFDSLFLVERAPIALTWCDCEGSVAQYLVRAGETDCESKLQALRYVLDGNLRIDVPISSQIDTFLNLLTPGRYELKYHKAIDFYEFIDFDSSWNIATRHDHFYPAGSTLVYTRPVDTLRSERVEYFVNRIKKGIHPIGLTVMAAEAWCEFVADGHHKLQAYRQLGIAPSIITVCRLDAARLDAGVIDDALWKDHPMADHYRRVKAKYDNA